MQIENCVALVTGANRGLGKAFVESLLAAGAAKVYAGARVPQSVTSTDARVKPVQLDVTQASQVTKAAQTCCDVNLLINNAGIMRGSPILAETSESDFRDEMEVNVFGILRMVRAFAPILARNGGGAIANMLSVVSWYLYPFNVTYGASKHAALAVTEGIRIQLKSQGTQVSAIYAGFIDTDMVSVFEAAKSSPRDVADHSLEGIRQGHNNIFGDTRSEEVWQTVLSDPEKMHAQMQQLWDERAIATSPA